jgi:hypothetical protein
LDYFIVGVDFVEGNTIALVSSNYCNDSTYPSQGNLSYNASYPTLTGNINIEPAWDLVPSGGKKFVRCGVFDTGVDWKHKDFNYNGINSSSSKIVDGWDYYAGAETKALAQGESDQLQSHGTAVTGIIGAQRNNNFKIAGIAGGNDSIMSTGIALYNFHLINNGGTNPGFYGGVMNFMAEAIVESTKDNIKNSDKGFELHIQNHSWRYDETNSVIYKVWNNNMLKQAVHFANRQQVSFVAARGNEGKDNLCYPAIIDDDWVLNVGGTGRNGCYSHSNNAVDPSPANSTVDASYGHNVDVGAPADGGALVRSLKKNDSISFFGATSAAAPHVAGVVGLLMSYLNDSMPSYKNLAPEDCEKIIEISAKDDSCHAGHDEFIGAGLLDAGKALQLVNKSSKALTHFGTDVQSNSTYVLFYTKVDSNKVVNVDERYLMNFAIPYLTPSKKYRINKYLVSGTFKHNLPPNHWIDTAWPLSSASNLYQNVIGDSLLLARERITIAHADNQNCIINGYVYELFDTNGVFKEWWPCNIDSIKNSVQIEYTVLSHLLPMQINNDSTLSFSVTMYPNPTSGTQYLEIKTVKNANCTINLLDITGRPVYHLFSATSTTGHIKQTLEIGELPSGMYMYEVQIDGSTTYHKIIKN